jgi:hypothetical protein
VLAAVEFLRSLLSAAFLNAYLAAHGAPTVNLDRFRTLAPSAATGAVQKKRLTNLMDLNVDTSWYTRYRAGSNPDFGATFPQAVTITGQPAIPISDLDTPPGSGCRRSRTRPGSTSPSSSRAARASTRR